MSAIKVENLSKRYVIGHQQAHDTLRDALSQGVRGLWSRFRRRRIEQEEFWALRDVSFEVQPGEVLGIIGRNGAGKSTLLKILSRITEPTAGSVRLRGRVASLLEVGTGFHPELTGRDNIHLNGAILGMSRAEIRRKFDEIVAFAEVERFLDTPVKRYSSGMYVRLAFAVAAHLEPEILIVDEVLAVGDADFQRKCIGRIGQVARDGRTVLFVSHNMQVVSTLTQRCVLLEQGRVAAIGPTADVTRRYLEHIEIAEGDFFGSPAPDEPRVVSARVITSEPGSIHIHGKSLQLEFKVDCPEAVRGASFAFQIIDSQARPVHYGWYFDSETPWARQPGEHILRCELPRCRLYAGRYRLTLYLAERQGGSHFQTVENICPFEVTMFGWNREWPWQIGAAAYLDDSIWSLHDTP